MKPEERIYRNSEVSEKALERRLVEKVKSLGFVAVKMNDQMNAGLPDRMIVLPSRRVLWVEVKSKGKKPTALQESRMRQLRALGHMVFVAGDTDELNQVLEYIEYYKI